MATSDGAETNALMTVDPAMVGAGTTNQRSSGGGWAFSPDDAAVVAAAKSAGRSPIVSNAGRAAAKATALQKASTTDHRATKRMGDIVYRALFLRFGPGARPVHFRSLSHSA